MIYLKLFALLFLFWPVLLLLLWGKMGSKATLLYTGAQLLSWWATVIGWGLLAYPCYRGLWVPDAVSADIVKTQRTTIDRWSWKWLNFAWGNKADGVSGRYAILNDGSPYKPGANPAWRAYSWSALRNSADGLKYEFAWDNGPLVTFWFFGSRRAGWLPMPQIKGAPRVPVLG